ncbi:MAG TPA: Mth938-like domain-containing protein [Dongiaceae bacterium]|nr:Mth938-like domain-containing protein [Dongiaceae bacterium]
MDVTPLIPEGRQLVEAYGDGGFKVSGTAYRGAVIVFPSRTLAWGVGAFADLTLEQFAPILAAGEAGEASLMLLGCGPRMLMLPPPLRQGLRAVGIVSEVMDTGAACRTYNVLLAEGRRVCAAMLAVD